VQRIEASLGSGGFKLTRDSVGGRRTVIGRRVERHLARRHTFVLVAVFKSDASADHLDRFQDEAGQYATTMRSGLGRSPWVVAVAVAETAHDAGDWARRPFGDRPGPLSYPVLVDLSAGRVVCPDATPDGGPGVASLRRLVEAHVVPGIFPP
jgi:hypothetical protein